MSEFEFLYLLITINNALAINPELVIGEERVEPGIVFIFEGAIKDEIHPKSLHLDENETKDENL